MITKRTSGLPLICLVCGDTARGINFNLMTCMSCKTFFRRHGRESVKRPQCLRQNNCVITRQTRSYCSACRLQKCLKLGMDPKLLGSRPNNCDRFKPALSRNLMEEINRSQLSQPRSLSLLEHDRSTLSKDEWNLLSNVIHAYDSINIISYTKCLLDEQTSLPPKLRSKPSAMFDIIKPFYSTFPLLVERTPYHHCLSTSTYKDLLHHNCHTFGTFNGIFVLRETNAWDYEGFRHGCLELYDSETTELSQKFVSRLDTNPTMIKIFLMILAFSTNCDAVNFDSSTKVHLEFNSIGIMNIQNMFVTMFWKYLLYQYGFIGAVRWFIMYIKSIVNMIQNMYKKSNMQHDKMIKQIIEDSAHLLHIED